MLSELYQELILDHGRHPRNFGPLDEATHNAEGYNPFCGDQVHVYLKLDGEVISEVKFEGMGCAISTASASMMTQAVMGKTREEAKKLFNEFHLSVTSEAEPSEELGQAACLCGVKAYPNRVKCATLAWHALMEALERDA